MLLKIALIISLSCHYLWSQGFPDEVQKQIDEILKRRDQMLKNFFDEDSFFDSDMDSFLQDFMHKNSGVKGLDSMEYFWRDSQKGREFVIKKPSPESQLEFKVENNIIEIRGEVHVKEEREFQGQKSYSERKSFLSQNVAIPPELDSDKMESRAEADEIILFFPFKKMNLNHNDKKVEDYKTREKISPTGQDKSI